VADGALPHHCERTTAPHQLRVCVVKRHTIPAAYAELARRANETDAVLTGGLTLSERLAAN
jgi:hypothetical protein